MPGAMLMAEALTRRSRAGGDSVVEELEEIATLELSTPATLKLEVNKLCCLAGWLRNKLTAHAAIRRVGQCTMMKLARARANVWLDVLVTAAYFPTTQTIVVAYTIRTI